MSALWGGVEKTLDFPKASGKQIHKEHCLCFNPLHYNHRSTPAARGFSSKEMHPQREEGDFFDLYPIKCSFKHNLFCSKDVSPLGKSRPKEISVHVIHRQRDREGYSLISLQQPDSLRRIFLSAEKLLEEGSCF